MNKPKLRILNTNIQSLNAHYDELLIKLSLKEEGLEMHGYDIVALLETWVKEENAGLYSIKGYKMINQPQTDGRRSGGVLVYVKEGLNIRKEPKIEGIGYEALAFTVRYKENCEKDNITLLLVNKDCFLSKIQFVSALEQLIADLNMENLIIMGDMNINLLRKTKRRII